MTDLYIVISLTARGSNARVAGLFIGTPSMMAIHGAVQGLLYKTIRASGGSDKTLPVVAMGLNVHDYKLDAARVYGTKHSIFRHSPTETPDSENSKARKVPSYMPHAECCIKMTLMLKLTFQDDDLNVDCFTAGNLTEASRGWRLAGGPVAPDCVIKIYGEGDKLKALSSFSRKYGSIIVTPPRELTLAGEDKIKRFTQATRKPITAAAKKKLEGMLSKKTDPDEETDERIRRILSESENRSGVAGTCMGYLAITPPTVKDGVKSGLPHSYLESCVGLIKYVRNVDFFKSDLDGITHEPFLWALNGYAPSRTNKKLEKGESSLWVLEPVDY